MLFYTLHRKVVNNQVYYLKLDNEIINILHGLMSLILLDNNPSSSSSAWILYIPQQHRVKEYLP